MALSADFIVQEEDSLIFSRFDQKLKLLYKSYFFMVRS